MFLLTCLLILLFIYALKVQTGSLVASAKVNATQSNAHVLLLSENAILICARLVGPVSAAWLEQCVLLLFDCMVYACMCINFIYWLLLVLLINIIFNHVIALSSSDQVDPCKMSCRNVCVQKGLRKVNDCIITTVIVISLFTVIVSNFSIFSIYCWHPQMLLGGEYSSKSLVKRMSSYQNIAGR